MPTDQILATEEMVGSGHATKSDTLNRFLNKMTAAGDILYASAAYTAARLGVQANKKLYGNAGGTAPVYAQGLKITSTTRDISVDTDQSLTGAGFAPSAVVIIAGIDGGNTWSIGFADKDGGYGVLCGQGSTTTIGSATNAVIVLVTTSTSALNSATVKTWGADGITLDWTKTGSPTGTANISVFYLW